MPRKSRSKRNATAAARRGGSASAALPLTIVPSYDHTITIRKKFRWAQASSAALTGSITFNDFAFILATRVDATHVNFFIPAFRLHKATLWTTSTSATPGILQASGMSWSDQGAYEVKEAKEIGFSVNTGGMSHTSLVPAPNSQVSFWNSFGSGSVIDLNTGASTMSVFEVDLEFQIGTDTSATTTAVTATNATYTMQQRSLGTLIPVGFVGYIP